MYSCLGTGSSAGSRNNRADILDLKISIITAVYKSEATVAEAIASVARQDYGDVEHIIIEGASPDGSLAAIQQAAHKRMKLISEPDAGLYDALNKGIKRSTGEIIGFVHSDDFLADQNVLRRIAEAFHNPAVEAVYSDLDYVSHSNTTHVVRHWKSAPFAPRSLRWGWMPPHPTLYLRREAYERLGVFDTRFLIAADYDFMLRLFSEMRGRTVYIPEVTYKMRLGGVSTRSLGKIRQKMVEDYRALQKNGVGGLFTLVAKNVSKLGQLRIG